MEGKIIKFSTKEKKDLLFLHGYLADGNSFAYQYPAFKDSFNIYAFDLKGFGKNVPMPYPYSLDDYASDVKRFMEDNGIEKPCVIAHSFGGRVAIKLLSVHPDLFSKLVLTGSAGLKPKKTIKKVVKKTIFNCLKVVVPKERLTALYSKDYQKLSPVMQKSFKMIVNEHLDEKVKKIKVPTLIINGKNDKETPLYMAKRFNKFIDGSKMVVLEGAGHFCFIDKKFKFNAEVKEFLLS